MKHFLVIFLVFYISLSLIGSTTDASYIYNYSGEDSHGMEEDTDRNLIDEELVLAFPEVQKRFRRFCVPRGGNCDHRPKSCCNSSSCHCNLWGANCKCQRMGFFQRWLK